jgi:hypothetical protein
LCQQLLLSRQVQVLVVYNLIPNTLGVCGKPVCGYPSVVLREEYGKFRLVDESGLLRVVVALLEPLAELIDRFLEFFGL